VRKFVRKSQRTSRNVAGTHGDIACHIVCPYNPYIQSDDLVQPSRQTRHSDPDLSFTTLAARTDVYKYSFFQEQYVIGTP